MVCRGKQGDVLVSKTFYPPPRNTGMRSASLKFIKLNTFMPSSRSSVALVTGVTKLQRVWFRQIQPEQNRQNQKRISRRNAVRRGNFIQLHVTVSNCMSHRHLISFMCNSVIFWQKEQCTLLHFSTFFKDTKIWIWATSLSPLNSTWIWVTKYASMVSTKRRVLILIHRRGGILVAVRTALPEDPYQHTPEVHNSRYRSYYSLIYLATLSITKTKLCWR
jgi:hypothetical protein